MMRIFSNLKEATNLAAIKFSKTKTPHGPQKGIRACTLVYGPAGDTNLKMFPPIMTHAHLWHWGCTTRPTLRVLSLVHDFTVNMLCDL